MHPALKLFCILWLFMGALASAVGLKSGIPYVYAMGIPLVLLSITGILGLRVAPFGLMMFWLSLTGLTVVQAIMGQMPSFARALMLCVLFLFFALVSFICAEDPPGDEEEHPTAEPTPPPGESPRN
jgi:hypothetical protein